MSNDLKKELKIIVDKTFTEEELRDEVWKPVPELENYYLASNLGRIKSLDRVTLNKVGVKMTFKGRILSCKSFDKDGYELYKLFAPNVKPIRRGHIAIARTFLPNPEKFPIVNHKNGLKNDNRVENLEWCSESHNILHSIKNGFQIIKKGEETSYSKLTEAQVLEMKRIKPNFTYTELGKMYGVNRATAHSAVTGISWKHLIKVEEICQ